MIREILVTIVLANGERVQGSISSEGTSRWGAGKVDLAQCVEPMDAMREAVSDCLTITP
jgi:hypothetical protein